MSALLHEFCLPPLLLAQWLDSSSRERAAALADDRHYSSLLAQVAAVEERGASSSPATAAPASSPTAVATSIGKGGKGVLVATLEEAFQGLDNGQDGHTPGCGRVNEQDFKKVVALEEGGFPRRRVLVVE